MNRKREVAPVRIGQLRKDPDRRYLDGMGFGRPKAWRIVEVLGTEVPRRFRVRDTWSQREVCIARTTLERWEVVVHGTTTVDAMVGEDERLHPMAEPR